MDPVFRASLKLQLCSNRRRVGEMGMGTRERTPATTKTKSSNVAVVFPPLHAGYKWGTWGFKEGSQVKQGDSFETQAIPLPPLDREGEFRIVQ